MRLLCLVSVVTISVLLTPLWAFQTPLNVPVTRRTIPRSLVRADASVDAVGRVVDIDEDAVRDIGSMEEWATIMEFKNRKPLR